MWTLGQCVIVFSGALSLVQGMHPVRHPYAGVCAAVVDVAGLGAVPALGSVPTCTSVLGGSSSCHPLWLCLGVGMDAEGLVCFKSNRDI